MAIRYLKPAAAGGSNSNAGTSAAAAWATFAYAAAYAWLPGDTLYVASGAYSENQFFSFGGGGNATQPVRILADEAGGPVITFAASMQNSHKFEVSGVGYHLRGLVLTQPARSTNANDRMLVAQLGASDVWFERCEASETYEPLKATAASRVVFDRCYSHDTTIGAGIVGDCEGCEYVDCTFTGWSANGVQLKGGTRNPRVRRCLFVADAALSYGVAIYMGGATTVVAADTWSDHTVDGESFNALADANVIIVPAGKHLDAGITFYGAKNGSALNNTLLGFPGWSPYTNGLEAGFALRTATGSSGWLNGNPTTANARIENNIVVRATQSLQTYNTPAGTNIYRNNTNYACDWTLGVGNVTGTWTWTGNQNRNPLLTLDNAVDWPNIDARLQSLSPERGAGSLLSHALFGGGSLLSDRDRERRWRGLGPCDRGAYESTHRRRGNVRVR